MEWLRCNVGSVLWETATLQPASIKLWTAAIVVPLDCGAKPDTPNERKIRPVGLAEVLTKVAESLIIEDNMLAILRALEPRGFT